MDLPDFRTIEGPKEIFDEQVRAAHKEGLVMSGQPSTTVVGERITYSVHMIRKPTFEQPLRRSVSLKWYSRW
jgi:hypothetical protein